MKDRITWVPSLLTGELIPKKTSVWDLDDEENEERNDRRQASLMETTPYSRPKNYETNIRIFQPPITPGSVLPYPFNRIMQNVEKRIPQKNPTKQTQLADNRPERSARQHFRPRFPSHYRTISDFKPDRIKCGYSPIDIPVR